MGTPMEASSLYVRYQARARSIEHEQEGRERRRAGGQNESDIERREGCGVGKLGRERNILGRCMIANPNVVYNIYKYIHYV